jgi:hypothetical protein
MTSFSPLNVYTSATARGEFLRPDVRALLADASVGPFCWVTIRDGQTLQAVPDPRSVVIRAFGRTALSGRQTASERCE